MTLNKEQRIALYKKWIQNNQGMTYMQFRRTVLPYLGYDNVAIVEWSGMWLGIETDGYTHS